ncbi:unnamed protein product [Larinioides sclopetarius]|uniref:RNA-directed DNA polymerase n=1 Tax=Larinioides sclopetarius TaxID=280406 RepID=A0AAV2B3V9_9ARAC
MGKPRLDPRAKTTGNSIRPVHTSINKYKGNKINQNSNLTKESEPRGFSKKFETSVDKRKRLQCFECGSYEHLRPQCPRIRVPKSEVNRVGKEGDRNLLDPYIKIGKINGYSMPILRDTGATVDVICQKYVNSNRMTGEHVWVKHIFDDHMTCLPVAQIDVEYGLGRVTTKAVVVEDKLDQGRYILGNQTADLLKIIDKSKNLNFASVNAVVTRSKTEQLRNDTNSLDEQINTEICEERIMEESEDEENEEVLPKADICNSLKNIIKVDSKTLIEEQQKSKELTTLLESIKTKGEKTNFDVKNGVLVRKKINKLGGEEYAIVVPEKLREQIKTMCHEGTSGHLGVLKTKDRLLRHFFWPNCYRDIEEFVKTCDPCQRVGKTTDKKKAPMVAVPVISEVFSKINVDTCGPLPTSTQGNKYIITVMCLASKYPDAVPVPDITSKSVVNALLQIFSRMGFPREIQTDQGKSFMSILTVEFLEKFGIKIFRSSIYHPQSNPVERFHRSVKRILKVLCIEATPEWETQIPAALFALRTVTHESTGFSPAELDANAGGTSECRAIFYSLLFTHCSERMERFHSEGKSDGSHNLSAKKPSIFRGLILAMLSGIFYSLVSVIVKELTTLHPGQIALYRFIAIFVTALPQIVRVGQNPFGPKKFRSYLILRGISGGANIFLNFVAIRYLSLSEATVIIFSSPVFVTVAARIFLKEPCGLSQGIGVVLTVTGIIFTTKLPSYLTEEEIVYTQERLCGLLAAIGAVLCTSFQIPIIRKMKSVHYAVLNFNFGLVTITETLILTAIFGNFSWHHCGIEAAYVVLLGLFSFVGQTMMLLALQCEMAGPVSTVKAASDIGLAFLWQIVIFHEDPDFYSIIGSVFVVFSIVLIGFNKWCSSHSNASN